MSQQYNNTYNAECPPCSPSREEKREKDRKAAEARIISDRLSYVNTILTRVAACKLMSLSYKSDGTIGAPNDKMRTGAVVFLKKVNEERGNNVVSDFQKNIYIPTLGLTGVVSAIANKLAEKMIKTGNFDRLCAEYGLSVAIVNTINSNFYITESVIIDENENPVGDVLTDQNMDRIFTNGEDAAIDQGFVKFFADKLFKLVHDLMMVVKKQVGTSIDEFAFNGGHLTGNQHLNTLFNAASASSAALRNVMLNFINSYTEKTSISDWVNVEHKKKAKQSVSSLNYNNILQIGKDIGAISHFEFNSIPTENTIVHEGNLQGYTFMNDLGNATAATEWSHSQLLKIKYKSYDDKVQTKSRSKNVEATKESFLRAQETRLLGLKQDQVVALIQGKRFFDPSNFNYIKGTGLDGKTGVETQKFFPNIQVSLENFTTLRNNKANGVVGQERDNTIASIILGCLRLNKNKFPVRDNAKTASAEFETSVQHVRELLGLLEAGSAASQMVVERTSFASALY